MGNSIPEWLNKREYPFKSHFFNSSKGRIHYIDEGEGEVILFLHGTPVWSFLYRHQIKTLAKNYRCIAVDHIGFGLSNKPKDFSYHPKDLSFLLEELIRHLNIEDITIVVHDFGGPIGLSYAIRNIVNIKRVVLFNTWLWSTEDIKQVKQINTVVSSWLGKLLYLNFNFSAKYLIPQSFEDKSNYSSEAKKHYLNVFSSKDERYGPYLIAKQLKGASDFYEAMWSKIDKITNIPTLVLWGNRDSFINEKYLSKWRSVLKVAQFVEFDCGHFPQEEKPNEVTKKMVQFLDKN